MKKHPALIFILSLTLLFSMTEIFKVTVLGFTMFTDADKAAQFCTCTGCSHDVDMDDHDGSNMEVQEMNHHEQQDTEQPSHCSTNRSDSGKAAVCACKTSPETELPVLYNSLDKVALLASVKEFRPSEKERALLIYQNSDEESLSKEIFHPPKQT